VLFGVIRTVVCEKQVGWERSETCSGKGGGGLLFRTGETRMPLLAFSRIGRTA